MKRIRCIGSVTADIIISPADHLPSPGTLQAVESTAFCVGGCASNAVMDLAKLGVPATLCCLVGEDGFGDFVLEQVRRTGADVNFVRRKAGVPTTSSIVCVGSDGERSFLYNPGSTSQFTREDIPDEAVEQADSIFVAGTMLLAAFDGQPCRDFLRECRSRGKFTAMDTAWDFEGKWLPKIELCLPFLDLFMPSYDEALRLSGRENPEEIADFFQERGVKSVIVKQGKDGAYFREADGTSYTLPTYRSIRPVDTTGAGDSFCAGFLCGLAQGWDYRRSGAFANAVGTHCIMAVGASTGIRSMADILQFMEKTPLV